MEESQVIMYELEKRTDGTVGIGNSIICSRAEAVKRIKAKTAKHPNMAIGIVPPEWQEVKIIKEQADDGIN